MPVEEMSGPIITKFLEKTVAWLAEFSLPIIASYHLAVEDNPLNEASPNAKGVEHIADTLLAPMHYIFGAKSRTGSGDSSLRFNYDEHLLVKSSLSFIALPISAVAGLPLKLAATLTHPSASHHIPKPLHQLAFGAAIKEGLRSPIYARRPGDENHLYEEKVALQKMAELFKKYEIPFWVDCGTCLGVYRHRGVIPWDVDIDVAILEPDHARAKEALKELDPELYQIQDWSNRSRPGTYLRLYVKATKSLIDIYHFAVDEESGMLRYILSNEESAFMLKSWKVHESRYKIPTPISVVFPLRPALLDGIEVFVPNKTKEYLQLRYGEDLSPVRVYNEKTGNYEKNLNHPYWHSVPQ